MFLLYCVRYKRILFSTATAERTFSTLRRLKSWMRTRMAEDRLTGLALMNVHTDIEVCVERVINRFGGQKKEKWTLSFK